MKMTCRELTDFLSDYLAGDLPDEVSGTFERHLGRCGDCRKFLSEFEAIVAAGCGAYADEPDRPVLPEDLVRAIMAAVRETPPAGDP